MRRATATPGVPSLIGFRPAAGGFDVDAELEPFQRADAIQSIDILFFFGAGAAVGEGGAALVAVDKVEIDRKGAGRAAGAAFAGVGGATCP